MPWDEMPSIRADDENDFVGDEGDDDDDDNDG